MYCLALHQLRILQPSCKHYECCFVATFAMFTSAISLSIFASTGHAMLELRNCQLRITYRHLAGNTPPAGFTSNPTPNAQAGSVRYNWPNAQGVWFAGTTEQGKQQCRVRACPEEALKPMPYSKLSLLASLKSHHHPHRSAPHTITLLDGQSESCGKGGVVCTQVLCCAMLCLSAISDLLPLEMCPPIAQFSQL